MMYHDKFVVVIKVDGKILREHDGVVYLPFNHHYSILLKNLSNRKALVKIEIDGREVTGGGLIIPHTVGNVVELERFIDNNDLNKGYKFKFIQKTKDVQEARGDRVDDGLIKVEWWFEEEEPFRVTYKSNMLYNNVSSVWLGSSSNDNPRCVSFGAGGPNIETNGVFARSDTPAVSDNSVSRMTNFVYDSPTVDDSPIDNEGITVEGSDSNQKFIHGNIGILEKESHIVILQLKGYTETKQEVKKPMFVQDKIKCKQCGKTWRSSQKFCGNCGARLTI